MSTAGIVIAIVLAAPLAGAAELRVTIDDRSPGRRCTGDAIVTAVADDDSGASKVAAERAPGAVTVLRVEGDRPLRVRAVSEGCWSTTAIWVPQSDPTVALQTFASATVHGSFAVGSERPPGALQASAFRIARDRERVLPADPEPIDCTLDFPRWHCVIPAELALDLRVEPAGFAPAYFWDLTAQPREQRDVGQQKVIAGSSLAGWVEDADRDPVRNATVSLSVLQNEHGDAGRAAAKQYVAKTNARGFFQLTGVEAGEYRLSSESENHSPVVVPALTIRPATAQTWPRALTHLPRVPLTVTIDPPVDRNGSPWIVRVTEGIALVPGRQPVSVTLAHSGDGLWSAPALRADPYRLEVADRSGMVVETQDIDLSSARPATITLSVHDLARSGTITVAGAPLAGVDVRFSNGTTTTPYVASDEDGRFQIVFPAAGHWSPIVYPEGRTRSKNIRAAAVEVVADSDAPLLIDLPGGRIRGRVLHRGTPVRAAVRVLRDGSAVAQEVTKDDGQFDFIALDAVTYLVEAESDPGTTAQPVTVHVRKDATEEIDLQIEEWRVVRAIVYTPGGQPASGAAVRVSHDGGASWREEVLGVRGEFEDDLPGGVSSVDLVVVTFSYPAAMVRLIAGNANAVPVAIRLQPQGGRIRVQPDRAYILRDDLRLPVQMFYPPNGFNVGPVVHLEAGTYAVCKEPRLSKECRSLSVAPGTDTVVKLETGQKEEGR
jgi:hypothetical protein